MIVTVCPPDLQIKRLVERGAMSEAEARQRLAAQWPDGRQSRARGFRHQNRRVFRRNRPAGPGGVREIAGGLNCRCAGRRRKAREEESVSPSLPFCHPAILFLQASTSVVSCAGAIRSSTNVFQSWQCGHCHSSSGAAVAAAHADVRIEVEDRVPRQLAVAVDQRRLVAELPERAPDRLVDAERVRVLHERGEQQIERVARAGRSPPDGARARGGRASPAGSRRSAAGTSA